MKKLGKIGLWAIVFLAIDFIILFMIGNYLPLQELIWEFSPVRMSNLFASVIVPLIFASLCAYFLTVAIHALVYKRISRRQLVIFYIFYFIFMFYVLLGRGYGWGNYGINLNPFNIFTSAQDPTVVLLNVLLFIPLGCLLPLKRRNLLFVAFAIALVEILQYVFKMGFCDIDDWLTNMLGYLLGTQLFKAIKRLKIEGIT